MLVLLGTPFQVSRVSAMFRGRTARFGFLAGAILTAVACDREPEGGGSGKPPPPPRPCTQGPVDAPRAEVQPAERLLRDQHYEEARKAFDALLAKYPESANLLVWRGDADLNDEEKDYIGSAERALAFYARARQLDGAGCQLSDPARYYLQLHSAFAHLRRDDAAQAERELRALEQTFPESAEVQYNLARASCLRSDVASCYQHFERTLSLARMRARPKFLRTHYSVADWVRRSETQSELGPLRAEPRYPELVRKMANEP